jgi:hypothetical protein
VKESFSEPEPNVIESTAGFSVLVLGRTGLRYTEGQQSVWIDSEVLAKPGPRAIALFKDRIDTRDSVNGPVPVSDTDRDRIAENVKRAFEARGYQLQVHADFDWL